MSNPTRNALHHRPIPQAAPRTAAGDIARVTADLQALFAAGTRRANRVLDPRTDRGQGAGLVVLLAVALLAMLGTVLADVAL